MKLKFEMFEDCLDKIAARGKLRPEEARQLLQEVATQAEQMRRTGEPNAFVKAAGELAANMVETKQRMKLDTLRNVQKKLAMLKNVDTEGSIKNVAGKLEAEMVGSYKHTQDSVENKAHAISDSTIGVVAYGVRKLGAERLAVSGAIDEHLAQELAGIDTGNKIAKDLAKLYAPVFENLRQRLNSAGAYIGKAVDFIAHTSHDQYLIRNANDLDAGWAKGVGRATLARIRDRNVNAFYSSPDEAFASWWGFTKPKLHLDTFKHLLPDEGQTMEEAQDKFGRSVFNALVTGLHFGSDSALGFHTDEKGYVLPGRDIAKSISQPRVLLWKDPVSWSEYMQRFSRAPTITQGLMQAINTAGKHIALMDRFGTKPAQMLQDIIGQMEKKYRNGDSDGVTEFGRQRDWLERLMSQLDGTANAHSNEFWARTFSNVHKWIDMSMLGSVGATHLSSIMTTIPASSRLHGIGTLEAYGNILESLSKGMGSTEREELLAELGGWSHGLQANAEAHFNPNSGRPGAMSSWANTFMKYTGLPYIFENSQAGFRGSISAKLAHNIGKEFGDLDPHLQKSLGNFRIGPKEWDLMRSVDNLRSADGKMFLTGRDISRVDPELVKAHLMEQGVIHEKSTPKAVETAVQNYTDDLVDRYNTYISKSAREAIVQAGARERAMIAKAGDANSAGGIIMRSFSHFKMWPIAAYDQLLKRNYHRSLSAKDVGWGVGQIIGLSMLAGYGRMTITDWAQGKPRRQLGPQTIAAAAAQGGGLGIFGDFLFGETNRMGGGLLSTLAGPLVGQASQLYDFYQKFMRDSQNSVDGAPLHTGKGYYHNLGAEFLNMAKQNVPYANLIYLKGAADYLVWYHLMEAVSPGWWDRTNKRLKREQGRTMSGYVPGNGVPWTPFGIGAR